MNSDKLIEKIQKGLQWGNSRYDIDQALLNDGYNPIEIDVAWQAAFAIAPSSRFGRPKNLGWWLGVLSVIAMLGFIFSLFFYVPDKFAYTIIDGQRYYLTKQVVDTKEPITVVPQIGKPYTTTRILYIYTLYQCEPKDDNVCKEVGKETAEACHCDYFTQVIEFDNRTSQIYNTAMLHSDGDIGLKRNKSNGNITVRNKHWMPEP